jgi:hypothetical protein
MDHCIGSVSYPSALGSHPSSQAHDRRVKRKGDMLRETAYSNARTDRPSEMRQTKKTRNQITMRLKVTNGVTIQR